MKNFELQALSLFFSPAKQQVFKRFYDFDSKVLERMFRQQGEKFWENLGKKKALDLFRAAAKRVPAYKDFLRRHGVRPAKIGTIEDFAKLPITNKENYIQKYPLEMRCWDGKLPQADIVAMSSGTSGQPTIWPRGELQEFEAAVVHELLYRSFFEIDRYQTLLLIGFPMGVYVSGIATLLPSMAVSNKGYPFTVVGASNNKTEILRVASQLQGEYQQIVLVGHPLFIKDVIESGAQEGIIWSKRRLRMMFCSEEFSERWRRYVLDEAGETNPASAISTYGSSELLLIAWETPLSIQVRARMESDLHFKESLIGSAPVPNLFQYNPLQRYIENVDGELIFTSASGTPLIRFNLHDRGSILSFRKIKEALKKNVSKSVWGKAWQLPFVTLSGRSDYKLVFYAANIYPEHIRSALGQSVFFPRLTGKFAMQKKYLKNMDEMLEVNVELRKGVKANKGLAIELQKQLTTNLEKVNLEYRDARSHLDKDLRPKIRLWPYQHQKYFKPGLKPKYILETKN